MAAFWIAEPAQALIVSPNELCPFAPFVRRTSQSAFMALIGGQREYNAAMQAGSIRVIDHLRYDRHGREMLSDGSDELGRSYLTVNPVLPFGLIWTANGSDNVQREMRRLFASRDDADAAAADVVKMIERFARDAAAHREAAAQRAG